MESEEGLNIFEDDWEDIHYDIAREVFIRLCQIDYDFAMKLWHDAGKFVIDEVLTEMITDGILEVSSVDEDGEWYFGLTEEGERIAAELLEES